MIYLHHVRFFLFTTFGVFELVRIGHAFSGMDSLHIHGRRNKLCYGNPPSCNFFHLRAGKDSEQNDGGGGANGFMEGINNFFKELDNFMDDASARRLGNGAAFYGKRKSNFYGKNDRNKKGNANLADPTEDYQAPNTGGYFQWMPDETGELRPVTRLRKQIVERNPKFWDRFYEQEESNADK